MRRRGNVLAIVAVAMTTLAGSAACVVDLAMGYAERARQQAAADAGALAATFHLAPPADVAAAKQAAVDWVAQNGYTITPADVSVWDQPGGGKAVTVRCHQPVDTVFARLFGLKRLEVEAASSAALGGVAEMPKGWVPFAVPAYRQRYPELWGQPSGGPNDWFVKSTPSGGYRLLTTDPTKGGPTRIVLREAKGSSGNYQALSVGGTGAANYQYQIAHGAADPMPLPHDVWTEPGKMAGPTTVGLADRLLFKGAPGRKILVPLIYRDEWDDIEGRSKVTVIGYASAHLDGIDLLTGQLTATFISHVVPGKASKGATLSPGVYAPMLIATP